MRLSTFGLITLLAAGCATPPPEAFESIPAPSTVPPVFPTPENLPVAAPRAVIKPVPASRPVPLKPTDPTGIPSSKLMVTPQSVLTGRVISFDATGHFVVLNFPVAHLPRLEQRMDVLRQGVKVGEIKVTGPQRDDHIVADVTAGEARPGDEVRER